MNVSKAVLTLVFVFSFISPVYGMDGGKATEIITNAYEDILNRKPDSSGLHEFRRKMVDDGWTEMQVRNALKESDEYKQVHADQIINNAYEDLLNRKVDRSGRSFLRAKISDENWTEKTVRDWIKQSEEYKKKHN